MEELIKATYNNGNPLPEFNNAAQVYNHFFWETMQPGGGDRPQKDVLEHMEKDFGSFTNFIEKFSNSALTQFGSGWVWLVLKREERRLEVVKTSNAINPLVWDDIPIISLDVWETSSLLNLPPGNGVYKACSLIVVGDEEHPISCKVVVDSWNLHIETEQVEEVRNSDGSQEFLLLGIEFG